MGNRLWVMGKESFEGLERLKLLELLKLLEWFFLSPWCYYSQWGAADVPVTPAVSVKRMASSMFISRGRTALRGTSTA